MITYFLLFFSLIIRPQPTSTLFPYTTLFRSRKVAVIARGYGRTSRGVVIVSDGQAVRAVAQDGGRSEEHTSELQSRFDLVCRLLLEKKKNSTYCLFIATVIFVWLAQRKKLL